MDTQIRQWYRTYQLLIPSNFNHSSPKFGQLNSALHSFWFWWNLISYSSDTHTHTQFPTYLILENVLESAKTKLLISLCAFWRFPYLRKGLIIFINFKIVTTTRMLFRIKN